MIFLSHLTFKICQHGLQYWRPHFGRGRDLEILKNIQAGTPAPPATGTARTSANTAKTSAGNQQTSANNQPTSDYNYPTSNSASLGGNINTNDANAQQTSGGGGGGLSAGAVLGISIGTTLSRR